MHDMATKAIYNNILFHGHDASCSSAKHEWMLRDWRDISLDLLFTELHELGIHLDKPLFISWAHESDSPEDLLLLLAPDGNIDEDLNKNEEEIDHLYLILFELWRRFLPDRRSLSIVADDIDRAILLYNSSDIHLEDSKRAFFVHQLLQFLLEYARLLQIALDEIHEGGKRDTISDDEAFAIESEGVSSVEHAIFSMTKSFFVHDIVRFIFDFVLEELNHDTEHDFRGFIEKISPFIIPPIWGECMQAHLIAYEDEERSIVLGKEIVKKISFQLRNSSQGKYRDLSSHFAMLLLGAKIGNKSLFYMTMKNILDHVEQISPDELFELISISVLYSEVTESPYFVQISTLLDELELSQSDITCTPEEYVNIERFSREILRKILEV